LQREKYWENENAVAFATRDPNKASLIFGGVAGMEGNSNSEDSSGTRRNRTAEMAIADRTNVKM